MKDISEYLSFDETGGIPKRSIKSIVNLPVVVRRWKLMESKFRDGNPSGRFVQMQVEVDGQSFLVNTGSEIIMEQLDAVARTKSERGESEQGFTCVVRRFGRGVKLFPESWSRNNVSQEKREEA